MYVHQFLCLLIYSNSPNDQLQSADQIKGSKAFFMQDNSEKEQNVYVSGFVLLYIANYL